MQKDDKISKEEAFELILKETRYRPFVPFLGAGISVASGFPSIKQVNQYLAKVDFAIHCGVFRYRYPSSRSQDWYRDHPSQFLQHFGWPSLGQLDADLWHWITETEDLGFAGRKLDASGDPEPRINIRWLRDFHLLGHDTPNRDHKKNIQDDLAYDLLELPSSGKRLPNLHLEQRDYLTAITQYHLRRDLERLESGADDAALRQWKRWKRWYSGGLAANSRSKDLADAPDLLYGNWESLLDHLCEGNFDLVDQLFSQLEIGRQPAKTHRYLTFLKKKLDFPLVLTTNFDKLLEHALCNEDLEYSVFDVHRDAELPDPYMVRRQFSVLKLHGSSYGLRLGERLKYPLDAVAREKILKFMPRHAFVLVVGFSGYERRMLQLLRAIAERGKQDNETKTKIVWLTLRPLSGWPSQLIQEFPEIVRQVVIEDAGTFLEELYYRQSSAYPAARSGFAALRDDTVFTRKTPTPVLKAAMHPHASKIKGRNKTERIKDLNHRLSEQTERRKPIHLFLPNEKVSPGRGSEWSNLAAASYINDLGYEYRPIWISLENHHTVAGLVTEFFEKAQQFDPEVPRAPLNLYDASTKDLRSHTSESLESDFDKVVQRIMDVFQRGRYVMVLDLLDCFGRPQMMHHGIPTYQLFSGSKDEKDHRKKLVSEYKLRVRRLEVFLAKLARAGVTESPSKSHDPGFGESHLCVTVGGPPSQRFTGTRKGQHLRNAQTTSSVKNLIDFAIGGFDLPARDRVKLIATHKQRRSYYCDFGFSDPEQTSDTCGCWLSTKESDDSLRASTRLLQASILVEYLAGSGGDTPRPEAVGAFGGLMSIFRRARPQPVVRSIAERWVNGAGANDSSVVSKSIGERLAKLKSGLQSSGSPLGPHSARLHEGGYLWLYREVRDEAYESLTENLSIASWVKSWRETGRAPKGVNAISALTDGLLVVTWHWAAARTYYADTYRATQDITAFYEYVYHRVSALRVITLLIAILRFEGHESRGRHRRRDVQQLLSEPVSSPDMSLKDGFRSVVESVRSLGVFSPLGKDYDERFTLVKLLRMLRSEGLTTLYYALHRNRNPLRQNATPSTMRGWAKQFLDRELHDLSGSVYASAMPKALLRSERELVDITFDREVQIKTLLRNSRKQDEIADANIAIAKLVEFFERLKFDAELADVSHENASSVAELTSARLRGRGKALPGELRSLKYAAIHDQILSQYEVASRTSYLLPRDKEANAATFPGSGIRAINELSSQFSDRDQLRRFLELKTQWGFCSFPNWMCFDTRQRRFLLDANGGDYEFCTQFEEANLREAEKDAIKYEKVLRSTATATDDDRRHRTSALTLRARSLYLRDRYRESHRWLDLAASGLSEDTLEQRVSMASVHLRRSELLLHSTFWHRFVRVGANRDIESIRSNVQKVRRAEQELQKADDLLGDAKHLPLWRVDVDLGLGLVVSQGILYSLDLPTIQQVMNESEFAVQSGKLERRVLLGMRHIRRGLDTIPILEKDDSTEVCIALEKFAHAVWQQLFVTFLAASSCLRIRCSRQLEAQTLLRWIGERASFLEMDLLRWRTWARSVRYTKFASLASVVEVDQSDTFELHHCEDIVELVLRLSLMSSSREFQDSAFNHRRSI